MNMRLVRFTKGLLDIMFYVGMAITAAIPVIFHYVGMYIEKFRTYYVVQCALYMASGVLALLLVLEPVSYTHLDVYKRQLWENSGHWDHYKDNMYTTVIDEEDYAVKPMNLSLIHI